MSNVERFVNPPEVHYADSHATMAQVLASRSRKKSFVWEGPTTTTVAHTTPLSPATVDWAWQGIEPPPYHPISYSILGNYNDKGEDTMIGGDTCHLCGADKKTASSFTSFKKKGDKVRGYCSYKCGTVVYKGRDGCIERALEVVVGEKCITLAAK